MSPTDSTPRFLRKRGGVFLGGIFALGLFACASLRKTELDQTLKSEGKYACAARTMPDPEGISENAKERPHARCYRDTVSVFDARAEWSRSFYALPDCSGAPMGVAEWGAPLEREEPTRLERVRPLSDQDAFAVSYSETEGRKLMRTAVEWSEQPGSECALRSIEVETKVRVDYENACAKFLPALEGEGDRWLRFSAPDGKGARSLVGYWDGRESFCRR